MDFKSILQNSITDETSKKIELSNLNEVDKFFKSNLPKVNHSYMDSLYYALNASILENIHYLKEKYKFTGVMDLLDDKFTDKLFKIVKNNCTISKLPEEESDNEDEEFNEQLVFNQ
jgi:hypothetical protein